MSGSTSVQEFCAANNPAPCQSWSFVGQAAADSDVNHSTLVFVNGARGGQSAETWESASNPNYDRVNLRPAGLSERQVQVAWVKVANPRPTQVSAYVSRQTRKSHSGGPRFDPDQLHQILSCLRLVRVA